MAHIRAVVVAVGIALSFGVFAPAAQAVTYYAEKQLSSDAADEIEPALVSWTASSVEYSVSVWMSFNPSIATTPSVLRYTAWNSSGGTTTGTIPTITGYTRYGDPILTKFPDQNRIFLVGVARHDTLTTTGARDTTDTAIVMWYSDNNGVSWSAGSLAATDRWTSSTADTFESVLDKPSAATGILGKLWIAYTRYVGGSAGNNPSWLQAQSTTATGTSFTWSTRATLTTANIPQSPTIMVDSNATVYVLCSRSGNNTIGLWRNQQNGTGWIEQSAVPSVGAFRGNVTVGTVMIRAVTVPVAKLDRTNRRISAVWHEANPSGGTQLRYAVYRLDTGVWSSVLFAAGTGTNHVNVGLDYDTTNGNVLVTWYLFGAGSSEYVMAGKYVTFDSNHNPQWVSDDEMSGRRGDATALTSDGHPTTPLRHIGEYHDVSYTNGKFRSAFILATGSDVSPWAFTVSYP